MLEIFKKVYHRIESGKRYKRTVNELNRLTDRELQDIGICRAEIHRVATEVL